MAPTYRPASLPSSVHDGSESDLSDLIERVLRPRGASARDVARGLIETLGGVEGVARASVQELAGLPGLGRASADRLVAAVELGRLIAARPAARGAPFRAPADVDRFLRPRVRDLEVEQFFVFALDARHRLRAWRVVSVGTLTASLVHPREVFRFALREAAAAVLIAHNHPSGDCEPSVEDASVTSRLVDAGRLVGIRVLDHVVVAAGGYYSFREAGRLETLPAGALTPIVRRD